MEDSTIFAASKPLNISVVYWGSGVIPETSLSSSVSGLKDANKAKACELHPSRPLVISSDRRQVVTVWNYAKKEVVMQKCLHDIAISAGSAKVAQLVKSSQQTSTSSFNFLRNKSFAAPSLPYHPMVASGGSQNSGATVLPENIVHVKFADKHAVMCSTGIKISSTTPTCLSDSMVLILCENCVMFYDYNAKTSRQITSSELSKQNPKSAEVIANNYCAIGCTDGHVRILDMKTWRIVADMNAHGRTDITMIKNIPICRDFNATSTISLHDHRITCRYISVGRDKSAFIWSLKVIGNDLCCCADDGTTPLPPIAKLKGGLSPTSRSGDVVSVHYDEDTATLFTTTAGDRAVRMWDLTELKDFQTRTCKSGLVGSVPTKMKSKRMSFFGGQDASTLLSAELEIECLDIMKPGKSLSGVLKSFSSFSPLNNLRFVDKTYIACNKGRCAAVIQSMDAATSAAFMNKSSFGSYYSGRAGSSIGGSVVSSENSHSELASVQHAGEGTSRLYILNEVLVPSLLGNYVSDRATLLSEDESYQAVETFQDALENMRVYHIAQNVNTPSIVALATSMGIVVLNLSHLEPSGRTIATHKLWGKMVLNYSEGSIHRTYVNDNLSSDDDDYAIGKEVVTEIIGNTYEELRLVIGEDDRSSASQITSIGHKKRFSIFGDTKGKGCVSAKALGEGDSVSTSSTLASLPAPIASLVGTCRPIFFPSASGKFCILHWKQSGFYLVISLKFKDTDTFSSSGSKCLKNGIVDRGVCTSIDWAGTSSEEECYALVIPSGTPQSSKKKSMFSWNSAAGEVQAVKKVTLLFKVIDRVTAVVGGEGEHKGNFVVRDITVNIAADKFHNIENIVSIFGGPLLCINVDSASGSREIHSRFYSMSCESTPTAEGLPFRKYTLRPVGPVMKQVRQLLWEINTFQCAVVIGSRVNILCLAPSESEGRVIFFTQASVSIPSSCHEVVPSLSWILGSGGLFVSTPTDIYLICTDYPYVDPRADDESQTSENFPPIEIPGCNADLFHVATSSFTNLGTSPAYRYFYCKPPGYLEVVGLRGASVVTAGSEGNLIGFPVLQSIGDKECFSPVLPVGIALSLGLRGTDLVQCLGEIPYEFHNTVGTLLLRRGLCREALTLDKLSLDTKIEIIVRSNMQSEAIDLFDRLLRQVSFWGIGERIPFLSTFYSPSSPAILLSYLIRSGIQPEMLCEKPFVEAVKYFSGSSNDFIFIGLQRLIRDKAIRGHLSDDTDDKTQTIVSWDNLVDRKMTSFLSIN